MMVDKRAQEETARSNKARESETYRSNRATEELRGAELAENKRHNIVSETETNRANVAKETETHRANVAKETENHRANKAKEYENWRSNTTREKETERANRKAEQYYGPRYINDWADIGMLLMENPSYANKAASIIATLFKQANDNISDTNNSGSKPTNKSESGVSNKEIEIFGKYLQDHEGLSRSDTENILDAIRSGGMEALNSNLQTKFANANMNAFTP